MLCNEKATKNILRDRCRLTGEKEMQLKKNFFHNLKKRNALLYKYFCKTFLFVMILIFEKIWFEKVSFKKSFFSH